MKKFLASVTTALLIAAGGVAITTTAASATPTEVCTPAEAWTETIVVAPEIPAVPSVPAVPEQLEVSHFDYQRYSWTGGPTETAPVETPPSANWQANTTNYEGAGHGTDPVGVAFQMDNPGKGNADWFFWTKTKVVDKPYVAGIPEIPGVPAVPAVTQTVEHPAVTCETEQPPVVTNECVTGSSSHSTNLNNLWGNVDTRSAGHYEYVEGGLHVWTDDNSSQAKVSLGQAISFPLHDTGVIDLDWTGTTPPPGVNLFVNFGADGNGTLVYESVYGQDLWLTNGSSAAVKTNAPVNGGGNGSQWHGTIDQWLTKYPEATVTGVAFSLGSGVLGDGVISSITVACGTHTFDFEREVPQAPEPILGVDTRTDEAVCVEPLNGTAEIETWVRDYEIAPVFNEETWAWEEGTEKEYTSDWYLSGVEVVDSEECAAVVVTPEPTPTVTPTVTPTATPAPAAAPVAGVLAATGAPTMAPFLWFAGSVIVLGTIAIIWMAVIRRRQSSDTEQ